MPPVHFSPFVETILVLRKRERIFLAVTLAVIYGMDPRDGILSHYGASARYNAVGMMNRQQPWAVSVPFACALRIIGNKLSMSRSR